MKKTVFFVSFLFIGLISCESSDVCHCEVSKKIYDENGQVVSLDYYGSRDGRCENLPDRDEEVYAYRNISCD